MEGHVAHLDHDIAGQSCGAEPEDHRRADQIRDHRTATNHQPGKGHRKQLLHRTANHHAWPLELAAAGCCCSRPRSRSSPRAISRAVFLLSCIAILSRPATGRHFSGGRAACASWESGKGRSSLASRNNGVLPIPVGGVKDSQVGKTKTRWRFWFFESPRACLLPQKHVSSISPLFIQPPVLAFSLFNHWFSTVPHCKIRLS